jgi:hypothetical protein
MHFVLGSVRVCYSRPSWPANPRGSDESARGKRVNCGAGGKATRLTGILQKGDMNAVHHYSIARLAAKFVILQPIRMLIRLKVLSM